LLASGGRLVYLRSVVGGYVVTCWNCLGEFEAIGAVWCSDDPKNPTKLCPFCLRCFCDATAEYKQEFWRGAPPQLVEELQTLGKSQDRLGDVLIRMKKITTPQLLDALVEQRETGQRLGEILIARCFVTREDVDSALRSQGTTRLNDTTAGDAGPAYWQQSTPDGVLDYLLVLGARKRASDVSLTPEPEQIAVRYRIDGFSFRVEPIPRSFEDSLERAVFAMFSLDPARRGKPQSARTTARLGEDDYDLVVQTVPGAQGLSLTVKLINRATFIKDFASLGLELEDRVRLVEEVRSGLGLILVTSPAYDGANTTCYSIMSFLAQGQRDVLSIEAPIQWPMDGVRQVEAEGDASAPRMEETLRAMAAVRPDVLMLSAIPDYPTLLLAAQLASSRLVIARATSATAARGLIALRDMGVPTQLLAGSLGLVLGQRLIRTLCRICRVEAEPPAAQTLEAHGIDRDEAQGLVFFKGKGCPTCNTIGYRGRRAIFEAIPASPEVRSALEKGLDAEALTAAAVESGMISIRERALGLVKSGVTSFDEFARLRL
jgi:type II secretory ATPase GspE/PulE/Tfp pilus assembly ATPase PilB-like protein